MLGKNWRGKEQTLEIDGEKIPIYPVGLFIKYVMMKEGEASPYDIYKRIKEIRSKYMVTRWKRYSYQYIINMFYWLRRLGYIKISRTEMARSRSGAKLHRKDFHVLTPKGKAERRGWINPFRSLYPETYKKAREKQKLKRKKSSDSPQR